jgi:hypothetical protein
MPWQRGVCTYIVAIVSATGTEDRGFEFRQGVRFLGLFTLQCCFLLLNSHCYCMDLSEINDTPPQKNCIKRNAHVRIPKYLYIHVSKVASSAREMLP